MNRICSLLLVGFIALVAITFSNNVMAEEVTLRAVSYTPINTEPHRTLPDSLTRSTPRARDSCRLNTSVVHRRS